jgi:hypothetical protein
MGPGRNQHHCYNTSGARFGQATQEAGGDEDAHFWLRQCVEIDVGRESCGAM